MDRLCSIKKCNIKYYGLGYCEKHYIRYRKYGDPLFTKHVYNNGTCSINGCNGKHTSKGWCNKHYHRWRKTGDSNKTKRIIDPNRGCKISNCNNKHYGKGYCQKHYGLKYPEIKLKANKKILGKISNMFDMTSNEYQYALLSWSQVVKNRDKSCVLCGSTKKLNAHHIIYKKFHPEISLNINNGITLCIKCHEEIHGFKIYANL